VELICYLLPDVNDITNRCEPIDSTPDKIGLYALLPVRTGVLGLSPLARPLISRSPPPRPGCKRALDDRLGLNTKPARRLLNRLRVDIRHRVGLLRRVGQHFLWRNKYIRVG